MSSVMYLGVKLIDSRHAMTRRCVEF